MKQDKDIQPTQEPMQKKESEDESLKLSSKKPSDNTLEKELGFSQSSEDLEDEPEENQDSEVDQLSNTSEDDFPPNQLIKASRRNSEIQKVSEGQNQRKISDSHEEEKSERSEKNDSRLKDETGKL